jgi:tRNA threonylcarbamoyl adenosine modification protein (Sua5/YciO/YrdC/YwlC family)
MQKVTVAHAAALLLEGKVGIIETDSIYGIAADLRNLHAVEQVFLLKHRSDIKPLPILAANTKQLAEIAELNDTALYFADKFWHANSESAKITPVTMIVQRKKDAKIHVTSSNVPTPETLAIRVIQHGIAHELLSLTGALAVTSANVSGMKNASSIAEVIAQFTENPYANDLFYAVSHEHLSSTTPSAIINTINVNKTAHNYIEVDGFGIEVLRGNICENANSTSVQ